MRKIDIVTNRFEQAYEIIRENICEGTLKPGERLIQEDLAADLGVSRQPIQQAMLLLKADGLVIESGGRGLFVAPMNPTAIGHHYQIRTQFDRLAATLVAERARASDSARFLEDLEKDGRDLIQRGREAHGEGGVSATVALDMQFHTLIYDFSGNPFISSSAASHWNFLRRVMISVVLHAERGAQVWDEHEEILERLLAGREDAADLAETHVTGAQKALFKVLDERGPEPSALDTPEG